MKELGTILENEDLKKYNTYKIGGKAKYLIKPYDQDKLIKLIDYLNKNNIKYIILGKGSNVILPDEDFDGAIILLDYLNDIKIDGVNVEVSAGILLNQFINICINNNLSGLENLYGIPGSLGGAISQNVGSFNSNISDNLISVKYLENMEVKEILKKDCKFEYRNSLFKHDNKKIILSAKFTLNKSSKEIMNNIIKKNMQQRLEKQPLEYPNAGSVFKNFSDISAGKLIEDLNLKGYHINGAYVSNKHANFIINKNKATSKDIKDLILYIKNKVKVETNRDLVLEQIIIDYNEDT